MDFINYSPLGSEHDHKDLLWVNNPYIDNNHNGQGGGPIFKLQ